jgi:hypothetical protein
MRRPQFILGSFLELISVKGWVHPKDIMMLEDLRQMKNPIFLSGIKPMTFRPVAQCILYYNIRNPFISIDIGNQ